MGTMFGCSILVDTDADNKTAELSDWNYDLLPIELGELHDGDYDLGLLGLPRLFRLDPGGLDLGLRALFGVAGLGRLPAQVA